jgi:hypothetical protein
MMNLQFMRDRRRTGWQIYMGVGILSTLAGYLLSALPQLIVPTACVGLSVWLIYSGLREHPARATVPSPADLLHRVSSSWRSFNARRGSPPG